MVKSNKSGQKLGLKHRAADGEAVADSVEDEEILEARAKFQELENKYKEQIKDEADKVREAGGLFILGTERHDSRHSHRPLFLERPDVSSAVRPGRGTHAAPSPPDLFETEKAPGTLFVFRESPSPARPR